MVSKTPDEVRFDERMMQDTTVAHARNTAANSNVDRLCKHQIKPIVLKSILKSFFSVFLAVCMVIVPMNLIITAAADPAPTTFSVSTSEEFVNAVKAINSGGDDESYVIKMQNDINVTGRSVEGTSAALCFIKGTTTIYGNDYTLTASASADSVILVSKNAVVNLGSENELVNNNLTLGTEDTITNHADLLGITDSGIVNIYEGVVFQNNSTLGRPGGAISVGEIEEKNATLNMYGGTIKNCQNMYTFYGGAVFVGPGSVFNMCGGTIENNKAAQYGGGVFNMGTFNMSGGFIQSNSVDNTYYLTDKSYMPYGGGVCNVNVFTMNGGVIQNNTAAVAGDDIFSAGDTQIKVDANKANDFGKLNGTNRQINGWFEDGNGSGSNRWIDGHCVEVTPANASEAGAQGGVALKAAHDLSITVTFDLNTGTWNDASSTFTENADGTYSETLESAGLAVKPADPTKDHYKFLSWVDENGNEFDFANNNVSDDITFYAKWGYDSYIKSVTLDKTYLTANGYTGAGTTLNPDNKPTEDITLTIEAYGSFNREAGKTAIPAFEYTTYTFTTGNDKDEIQIDLPDFNGQGIGDYWYKVTETEGRTAGVTYDNNEYYMHIVVTHEDAFNLDDYGISQITFHKNAPDENGKYNNDATDKSTGFTNTYGAGRLTVKKDVKGNFVDRTKTYDVTVTFNAPSGKTVMNDIYYGDNSVAIRADEWTDGAASVTLHLGAGDSITFTNIPDGVTYTVAEADYTTEGYKNPVYSFDNADEDGDTATENNAQGKITDDADIVKITNEKNAAIDIGVILDNKPYAIIILLVISTAAVMFVKRRKTFDAE